MKTIAIYEDYSDQNATVFDPGLALIVGKEWIEPRDLFARKGCSLIDLLADADSFTSGK